MKLILLRHGDRSPGFSDVPLSEKGHAQARELTQKKELLNSTQVYCSPKRRALQTIEPLMTVLGKKAEVTNDLDQMRHIESPTDFLNRIQRFIDTLPKNSSEIVLLCSHSDWLQQAVLAMGNEQQTFAPYSFFSCAEYKFFNFENNQWTFQQ
jgi:broad specificity phosphatase PhoE